MSMPEAQYVCTKCNDLHGYLSSPLINSSYKFLRTELTMEWESGYCLSCNRIGRLKEYVPTTEDLCQRRTELMIRNVTGLGNLLLRLVSSRARKWKLDYFRKVEELRIREILIDYRKGDEFCYHCGSREVIALNFKNNLKYENLYYQGEQDIGFKHPGCGGDVILKAMNMRFAHTWPEPEYFDENGDRVGKSPMMMT